MNLSFPSRILEINQAEHLKTKNVFYSLPDLKREENYENL